MSPNYNDVKTHNPLMQSEPQPIPDTAPTPALRPVITPEPAAASPSGSDNTALDILLNPQPTLSLLSLAPAGPTAINHQPLTINSPPALIVAQPVPASVRPHKARRKGRIASLPKDPRDMVNRMLANGVPYKNIVAALDELGFQVTERNISNWATGGYRDWLLEQDLVLENRLDQDHLVDHIRRNDATELPEVGLQAAATRLSQLLLQKTARAENVEANLTTYSQMIDILCRLNREIGLLQKQRNDSQRSLGNSHNPDRIKDFEQSSISGHERHYSNPPDDSDLPKPSSPPLLFPTPTSELLAQQDFEEAQDRQVAHQQRFLATLRAINGQQAPPPASLLKPPAAASSPGPSVGSR